MTENTIFVKKYDDENDKFPISEKEVWRYSGYLGLTTDVDAELLNVFEQVKLELKDAFSYRVCYRRMDITWKDNMPVLPFPCESKNLATCLRGSSEIIIFAATVGLTVDRHIAKYQRFSPVKALLMQAYGAERVESLCEGFCKEIEEQVKEEGLYCTNRFSPGYGDLPLDTQRDVIRLLDCNRQIGISLNESLLMTPSKSVTAIFGLGKNLCKNNTCKCASCEKTACEYRRI